VEPNYGPRSSDYARSASKRDAHFYITYSSNFATSIIRDNQNSSIVLSSAVAACVCQPRDEMSGYKIVLAEELTKTLKSSLEGTSDDF